MEDNNIERAIEANNDGNRLAKKEDILKNCDVIFCATGNRSIVTSDLVNLKRGCYLASVTSADDEFGFEDIGSTYKAETIGKNVQRYYKFEKSFYLMNNGNAVNFIHNAVVGDFIHLVKAEMLMGIKALKSSSPGIHEVDSQTRKKIAVHWLNSFGHSF